MATATKATIAKQIAAIYATKSQYNGEPQVRKLEHLIIHPSNRGGGGVNIAHCKKIGIRMLGLEGHPKNN